MPKQRKNEEPKTKYYRWLLYRRQGVYVADGRSNDPPLGRNSLGTRDKADALIALEELDLVRAVENGVVDSSLLKPETNQTVSLEDGRRLYEIYVKRPAISGGPRPTTAKRYRAVLDKFTAYCDTNGIRFWNQVNRRTLDGYAGWLDGEAYAYATEYLELNTIKQILKFLVEEEHLPSNSQIRYPMRKPDGTDTYCYRPQEVGAMISYCQQNELHWMRHIILALASTGLRIGELASLRWSDIQLDTGMIALTDESQSNKRKSSNRRTTKTGQSRTFPIHETLKLVLDEISRSKDGRIFHGSNGGNLKADKVRRALVRDVLTPLSEQFPSSEMEIGFKDGRLHSFRHYFCSICANAGIPEQVLMRWLGHRNSKMVRRYYHLHDEESRRQMARINITGSN